MFVCQVHISGKQTFCSLEAIGAYLHNKYEADTPLWFLTNVLFYIIGHFNFLQLHNRCSELYLSETLLTTIKLWMKPCWQP